MKDLTDVIHDLAALFDRLSLPYVIMGGIAVRAYGLPRPTYDVDFTAPRFEGDRKVKNARITVRHNGVVIHDDVEIATLTPGGTVKEERPKGPLHLQNHGNPVRYRNIWVLPKP